MYSGVSMLTLTPLPKVLSMLPPLGELTLGASAMLDLDTLLELELDKPTDQVPLDPWLQHTDHQTRFCQLFVAMDAHPSPATGHGRLKILHDLLTQVPFDGLHLVRQLLDLGNVLIGLEVIRDLQQSLEQQSSRAASPYCLVWLSWVSVAVPRTNIDRWLRVVMAQLRFPLAVSSCLMSRVISFTISSLSSAAFLISLI